MSTLLLDIGASTITEGNTRLQSDLINSYNIETLVYPTSRLLQTIPIKYVILAPR